MRYFNIAQLGLRPLKRFPKRRIRHPGHYAHQQKLAASRRFKHTKRLRQLAHRARSLQRRLTRERA